MGAGARTPRLEVTDLDQGGGAREKERWKILGPSEGRAPGLADRPDCGGDDKDVLLCPFPNLAANISKPFLLLPCSFLTLSSP